ncbi:thymic stromal cotransporter homolog [Gadus macrocephalus]|uniref:thymic stromal cotransporter homolog n=1 Tax=Gadus macrocephalus TaxID=80720 RepID=UPI0028CB2408|nr:thymic stromal cotransporter homolog [Gadus macrocephalus]
MGTHTTLWAVCRKVETLVVLQQLGGALFDTALQVVVKERSNSTDGGVNSTSTVDDRQRAMSDFFMTYNLLGKLTPIVPAIILAKLSDRGWRKAPIIAPLLGYMASRLVLLLVVVLGWPIQVMWVGVSLHGFSGGFSAIWAGVMTVVSLGSTEQRRSGVMMRVELLYGLAGLLGSLVSGHLFQLYGSSLGQGTVLVGVSLLLYGLCLLHAVSLLQVSVDGSGQEQTTPLIRKNRREEEDKGGEEEGEEEGEEAAAGGEARSNRINIGLLFVGGVLYDVAVAGAMEILVSFQMKEPLNWNAKQVGYGNASGFLIFLTSFLGVMVMSRFMIDSSLIIVGMLSFASGIYFMAFVTKTYQFYLARSLMLFALISMPTIRSMLSQQVTGSSYGIVLTSFQLSFKVASLVYTPTYTKIYQHTLDWLPGFVFLLSSSISVLATIPISIMGCRLPLKPAYRRIEAS